MLTITTRTGTHADPGSGTPSRRCGFCQRCGPFQRCVATARRSPFRPVAVAALMALLTPGILAPSSAQAAQDPGAGVEAASESTAVASRPGGERRALAAVRLQGTPPLIDGRLDDAAWRQAPVASGFVQVEPRAGEPASEATEVRVLYDDDALYVAFRAWDRSPDLIAAQLTRRDQPSHSDRVHVIVDSYHDRRTAFHFAVNPLGVKLDLYRYDDTREDPGWDAVWDVATSIDEDGWTAEFRIPLSQLRFSGAPLQDWGINFGRDLARRNELSVWAPIDPNENGVVSRSGTLEGLRDLPSVRRMELLPYTVARLRRAPGDPANPFYRQNDGRMELGGDLKMGLTSNLTLDLTVNPDFGQVEADPAQVNLTAFETFLPERRPFFAEGAGIFQFGIGVGDGDGANQSLFYSRRIGRAPQGASPAGDGWVDRPSQTRILTAGKLSGKTENGWSVGVMSALTGSEEARFQGVDGSRSSRTVEPLTHYSVARVQRDLRGGETSVGGIVTSVLRDAEVAGSLGLRERATAGGVDVRHRFREGSTEFRGFLLGSRVSGSPAAILATQRAPARYFQRPDADHLTLDPEATSLTGWSGHAELMRMGGGPWRMGSITQYRSPGFEVNDLGFMPEAGSFGQIGFVGYRNTTPGRHFRNWGLNSNVWSNWTSGWERTNTGTNLNGQLTLLNNVSAFAGVNRNSGGLNPTLLRGGPGLRTEASWNGWAGVNSDGRRDVQISANHNWMVRPEADSWTQSVSANLRWRPSERATLRTGPFVTWREEDRQWVGRIPLDGTDHFLFARMEQTTVGLTARMDLAVTPTLTLQLYGQPFVSAQSFGGWKQVANPRARQYDDRFVPVTVAVDGRTVHADLRGDGTVRSFGSPDFRVAQFRSNAVIRWEYRPGSAFFLVWSQSRDDLEGHGEFQLGEGVRGLFGQPPENVLMVKFSYWLNP